MGNLNNETNSGETDNRITQSEMVDMFGDSMPIEAANLIFWCDEATPISDIRMQLQEIADNRS